MWKKHLYPLKKKFFVYIGILLIIFAILFVVVDHSITSTVIKMSEIKVRVLASNAINESIYSVVNGSIKYSDLINVCKDKDGKVTMLQAYTIKLNNLATQTAMKAQDNLNKVGSEGINLPIGSVIGGQLLAGQGPMLHIKIIPAGSVTTEYKSEFQNAGINQTRHKIYMIVKAQLGVVVPSGSHNVEVESQVPIAETIIVGNVPNTYVNMDGSSKILKLVPGE